MKTAALVSFVAVLAAPLLLQPALAEPARVEIHGAPAVVAGYTPESPAAAFDRLFASGTAIPVRPLARASAGAFERHFQRALWSAEWAMPTLAVSAEQRNDGIRR